MTWPKTKEELSIIAAKKLARRKRAGRRKCTRCKIVWNKPKGVTTTLCAHCKSHCSRCDILLTNKNSYRGNSDSNKPTNFRCRSCICEVSKLTQDYDRNRDTRLIKTFGITAIEYDKILKTQNGVCWICNRPPKPGGKRLSVDHLHSKGEKKRNPREKRGRVRGLLCWHCNAAIGKFNDETTKLRKAADYLETWPAQQVLKEK